MVYASRMMTKKLATKLTKKMRKAELAHALNVNPMVVRQWFKRRIPAEWVLKVEEITGISRHEIRRDIYPVDGKYQSPS